MHRRLSGSKAVSLDKTMQRLTAPLQSHFFHLKYM